jgi:DNA mismatch repair ATPase MutS
VERSGKYGTFTNDAAIFLYQGKAPDCILMFRVGDFYEMFYDDAKTVSRELELVLKARTAGTRNVRLCAECLFTPLKGI